MVIVSAGSEKSFIISGEIHAGLKSNAAFAGTIEGRTQGRRQPSGIEEAGFDENSQRGLADISTDYRIIKIKNHRKVLSRALTNQSFQTATSFWIPTGTVKAAFGCYLGPRH